MHLNDTFDYSNELLQYKCLKWDLNLSYNGCRKGKILEHYKICEIHMIIAIFGFSMKTAFKWAYM